MFALGTYKFSSNQIIGLCNWQSWVAYSCMYDITTLYILRLYHYKKWYRFLAVHFDNNLKHYNKKVLKLFSKVTQLFAADAFNR